MFEFLRTERFNILASCVLGIAIVAVFKTPCKQDCTLQKAPSPEEVTRTTYQIRTKCYQFKTAEIECPTNGKVIEPFQV